MPKLNLQSSSTHSHSVTEYHIHTDHKYDNFFKLTKKELTDLVQVGEVLIFKSHLDEQGTLLKCSDVDMYQEINFFIDTFEKNKDRDCVIFSRYVVNGDDLRSHYRKLPSLILNKTCQYLLSNKIKDYTSCIMFFKRDLLSDILPQNSYYANFIIEFVFSLIIKKKNYLEIGFIQKTITEQNSKSAPNKLKFFKNGFFYLITILKCVLLKIKYKL